jgi:hypothetical protein
LQGVDRWACTHDGKGGATVVVKFIEFRPPKKKGGSPSGVDDEAARRTGSERGL